MCVCAHQWLQVFRFIGSLKPSVWDRNKRLKCDGKKVCDYWESVKTGLKGRKWGEMHLSVKPQKSNFYIFICALYSIMLFNEIKHIFSKCDFF